MEEKFAVCREDYWLGSSPCNRVKNIQKTVDNSCRHNIGQLRILNKAEKTMIMIPFLYLNLVYILINTPIYFYILLYYKYDTYAHIKKMNQRS